jgi:hypothetical protein
VPDFWEELKSRRQLLAEIQQESGNTPFTFVEQRQIAAQLEEIKRQVREQFEPPSPCAPSAPPWKPLYGA